jgi:hypothetical protein
MASSDAVTEAVLQFKSGGDTPAFQKELTAIWTAEQGNQQQVTNDLRSLQAQTGVNVASELGKLGFPSAAGLLGGSDANPADHSLVGSLGQTIKYDAANQIVEIDYPNQLTVTLNRDSNETVTSARVNDPSDKDSNVTFFRESSGQYSVYNDKGQKEVKVVTNVAIAPDGSAVIKGKIGIFAGTEKVSASGDVS